MLTDLPAELLEPIISSLDYFSLINVSQTNHYFHNLITRVHIRHALLDLEYRAEREGRPLDSFKGDIPEGQWSMISTHLPCYKCLLALPTQRYFLTSQRTAQFALGESSALRRRCTGCMYNQRVKRLKTSELFFSEGNTWIECVRCEQTKRYGFKEMQQLDWSNIAWSRGRCCFDCYWADRGGDNGEVKLVPYELDGHKKAVLEVPIQREELKSILDIHKLDVTEREAH